MNSSSDSSSDSEYSPNPLKRQRYDTDSEDDDSSSFDSENSQNPLKSQRHDTDSEDDDSYPIDCDSSMKGILLIFNECSETRRGSDKDCEALHSIAAHLKLLPVAFQDKDKEDILEIIERCVQLPIQEDAQVLMIAFMSHGDENGIETNDEKTIDIPTDVYPRLDNDVAPLLANKPKLILQQACRGDILDSGVSINASDFPTTPTPPLLTRPKKNHPPGSQTTPTQSDICVLYSSPFGFQSLRHPDKGSTFIQTLANTILTKSAHPFYGEWYQLYLKTHREMAKIDWKFRLKNGETVPAKGIPEMTTTLTKNLFLNPSPRGRNIEEVDYDDIIRMTRSLWRLW